MLTACFDLFEQCVRAVQTGELIESESDNDKEFHFQNWVRRRLEVLQLNFAPPKRNSYPDFRLVKLAEGYEVKGLKSPGRYKTFDSNSQAPSGHHDGADIFYLFGRYPKKITSYPRGSDGRRLYPVIDLVLCHGDFLNVDREYEHENLHVKGFGAFGDIMIRDRKMYVVPTPFALTDGTTGLMTLIVPDNLQADDRFQKVGDLIRVEAAEVVISYNFDLQTNRITAAKKPNPNAGRSQRFSAFRLKDQAATPVTMVSREQVLADLESDVQDSDAE